MVYCTAGTAAGLKSEDILIFIAGFNNGHHYVANDDTWTGKWAREHLVSKITT